MAHAYGKLLRKPLEAVNVRDDAYCASVAGQIASLLAGRDEVDISEVQTLVENLLMEGPHKKLARAYIEYRHDRDLAREKQGRLNKEIQGFDPADQCRTAERKRQ